MQKTVLSLAKIHMRSRRLPAALLLCGFILCEAAGSALAQPSRTPTVLPQPEPPFGGTIGRTAKESKPDFPRGVEAPKGAPNVLLMMTDDVGFHLAQIRELSRLLACSALVQGTVDEIQSITAWRRGEKYAE